MNWFKAWSWRWGHGKKAPSRRAPNTARLAVETLEDRLVPSSPSSNDSLYQVWRQQTFHIDDAPVAQASPGVRAQASVPANASFGSLIGLPSAFANTPYRGDGYSVALIDTGIDYNNPDLGGGFGPGHRVIAGWNFVNNSADPMDDNGHGTHVAGIIGSSDGTYSGVAPDVNLIALKVLDANGSGTYANVQSALDWVVANQAKYHVAAVNMSLGAGNYTVNPYTFLDTDFSALKNDGVFISVAAGNNYFTDNSAVGLAYPAVDPLVVSVGAVYDGNFGSLAWASGARDYTTGPDHIASFSQRGPALSIMAPGAMITSTYLHDTFQAMAGTSMASPVVAGASILIHQALDARHQIANEDTILSIMKSTGVSLVDGKLENDNVVHTGLTFKRLDLGAALASLGNSADTGPILQPISDQQLAPGSSVTLTLNGTDPDGDPVTFSASVLNPNQSQSQAYQLKQQLGLIYMGTYFTNVWGQNEKWMRSTSGAWYCILPNGQLRRWAGSMPATLQPNNLIATLDPRFYADPSLLWNAQPGTNAAPTLTIAGNQLTIKAPAGLAGSFQIQVTASDGKISATRTFTVTIQQNSNAGASSNARLNKSSIADEPMVGTIGFGTPTSAAFNSQVWVQSPPASSWTNLAAINGDAKLDLISQNDNSKWYVADSTGDRFSSQVWTAPMPLADNFSVASVNAHSADFSSFDVIGNLLYPDV
jgi:subtilisin family serine protease